MYVLHMYVCTLHVYVLIFKVFFTNTSSMYMRTYDLSISFRFVWSIAAVGSQAIHDEILVESVAMATLSEVQPPTNCTSIFQAVMEE